MKPNLKFVFIWMLLFASLSAGYSQIPKDMVGAWELWAFRTNKTVHPPNTILITFNKDGSVQKQDGCNSAGARLRIEGNEVEFSDAFSTKKACKGHVSGDDIWSTDTWFLKKDTLFFSGKGYSGKRYFILLPSRGKPIPKPPGTWVPTIIDPVRKKNYAQQDPTISYQQMKPAKGIAMVVPDYSQIPEDRLLMGLFDKGDGNFELRQFEASLNFAFYASNRNEPIPIFSDHETGEDPIAVFAGMEPQKGIKGIYHPEVKHTQHPFSGLHHGEFFYYHWLGKPRNASRDIDVWSFPDAGDSVWFYAMPFENQNYVPNHMGQNGPFGAWSGDLNQDGKTDYLFWISARQHLGNMIFKTHFPRIALLSNGDGWDYLNMEITKTAPVPDPLSSPTDLMIREVPENLNPTGNYSVSFFVGTDGRVKSPVVVRPNGNEAAVLATQLAQKMTFKPARIGKAPVVHSWTAQFNFNQLKGLRQLEKNQVRRRIEAKSLEIMRRRLGIDNFNALQVGPGMANSYRPFFENQQTGGFIQVISLKLDQKGYLGEDEKLPLVKISLEFDSTETALPTTEMLVPDCASRPARCKFIDPPTIRRIADAELRSYAGKKADWNYFKLITHKIDGGFFAWEFWYTQHQNRKGGGKAKVFILTLNATTGEVISREEKEMIK